MNSLDRYNETTEEYSDLFELQQDSNRIIQKFRDAGKLLDVEITIDLFALTITVSIPKGEDED